MRRLGPALPLVRAAITGAVTRLLWWIESILLLGDCEEC